MAKYASAQVKKRRERKHKQLMRVALGGLTKEQWKRASPKKRGIAKHRLKKAIAQCASVSFIGREASACGFDWVERSRALRTMGFVDYPSYLASALWKEIRARILLRAHGKCERCNAEAAVAVHHRSYRITVLRGFDDEQLVAICNDCHEREHGINQSTVAIVTRHDGTVVKRKVA